jgi:hypothetical protein
LGWDAVSCDPLRRVDFGVNRSVTWPAWDDELLYESGTGIGRVRANGCESVREVPFGSYPAPPLPVKASARSDTPKRREAMLTSNIAGDYKVDTCLWMEVH